MNWSAVAICIAAFCVKTVWTQSRRDDIVVPADVWKKCSEHYRGFQKRDCINRYREQRSSTKQVTQRMWNAYQQECMRLQGTAKGTCLAELARRMNKSKKVSKRGQREYVRSGRRAYVRSEHGLVEVKSRQTRRHNSDLSVRNDVNKVKIERVVNNYQSNTAVRPTSAQQTGQMMGNGLLGISVGMKPDGGFQVNFNGKDSTGKIGQRVQIGVKQKVDNNGKNINVDILTARKNCDPSVYKNCMRKKMRLILYP